MFAYLCDLQSSTPSKRLADNARHPSTAAVWREEVCVCASERILHLNKLGLFLCVLIVRLENRWQRRLCLLGHAHIWTHTPHTYIAIWHSPTSNELHYATLLHWTLVLDAGCIIRHIVLSQMCGSKVPLRMWIFLFYLATPPRPCDVAGLPQLTAPPPLHAGIGSPANLENLIPQKLLNDCVLAVHFCVSYGVGCLNTHTDISIFL